MGPALPQLLPHGHRQLHGSCAGRRRSGRVRAAHACRAAQLAARPHTGLPGLRADQPDQPAFVWQVTVLLSSFAPSCINPSFPGCIFLSRSYITAAIGHAGLSKLCFPSSTCTRKRHCALGALCQNHNSSDLSMSSVRSAQLLLYGSSPFLANCRMPLYCRSCAG